jgi:uncharacterized protein with ParB-like and HNH nuclease domain
MAESDPDFAPIDQQEDIDDIRPYGVLLENAVLWSVDWTTETLISQLNRENIELNPIFQRRSAWNNKRKSLFVESIILGLPIPQIILAEEKNRKGKFIVIDGKQRLLAIRQFASEEGGKFTPLKLEGLDDKNELNGLTYSDLKNDLRLRDVVDYFDNQPIRTVIVRDWKNEEYLYSVFCVLIKEVFLYLRKNLDKPCTRVIFLYLWMNNLPILNH